MLTLLLVGRSGNGRSSVGNTILGDWNAFKVTGSSKHTSLTHRKQQNEKFVVLDCIGIGDTRLGLGENFRSALCTDAVDARKLDRRDVLISTGVASVESQHLTLFPDDEVGNGQMESFVIVEEPDSDLKERENLTAEQNDGEHNEVCNAITTEAPLFHALIFVMKYGVRFTKQEKDAVQIVKSVFGENVFKDWGILVFSNGDNFYQDSEDDGTTFESWCWEQTGDIRSLFQEVDYRCVIFDNKTRVETKQAKQRHELNVCIQRICEKKNTLYTVTHFKKAELNRINEEELKPLQRETELILRKAQEKTVNGDMVDWVVELEVHLGDYLLLLNNLDGKDRNGALTQMRDQLHDQIKILNDLLAKQKSGELQENAYSLQILDNVKTQLNHLATCIISLFNLSINIKDYFKSLTK